MSSSEPSNSQDALPRRRKRKDYSLLVLAAGIFLFGVAAGGLYYMLRPVTLRIAVGPAGSDDQKLVQALAQTFARDGSAVRLHPVTTEGAVESIALLAAKKADLAVARGDLDLPADAQSVAILRKNVVVLWSVPGLPAKGARTAAAENQGTRRPPRSSRWRHRAHPGQCIPAARDPDRIGVNADKVAVTQFRTDQIAEMARDPAIEAFMAVGPLDSKITTEAIAATANARGEPKFLPIDVSETISKKHPRYEAEEIPGSTFNPAPARPEDKIDTVSVNHLIVAPKSLSETTAGAFVRQLFAVRHAREGSCHGRQDRTAGYRQGRRGARASGCCGLYRRQRTHLPGRNIGLLLGRASGSVGLGSGGAWLRHYFKRDEREQYGEHRDDLLALISKVRQAESPDELTAMQGEVDGMLREALDCYDDGAIEEGDLAAIGLVLDQFNHAVADRRIAIGPAAAEPARSARVVRVPFPATPPLPRDARRSGYK